MNKGILIFLVVVVGSCVVARGLEVTEPRSAQVGGGEIRSVVIEAAAGSLEIQGQEGLAQVDIEGTARASTQSMLDQIQLHTSYDDGVVSIRVELPGTVFGHTGLDLVCKIPAGAGVEIRDTSGSIQLDGAASLSIDDSSGSIEAHNIGGDVAIDDSSGSIGVYHARGEVRIEDGSGSITIDDVGSVVIDDGSGSISITHVAGNVLIEEDGSGSIGVAHVGGDFIVQRDGTGSINHRDVAGEVRYP